MNNTQRLANIRKRLTESLQPTLLNVIDESHQHVGHVGAQSGAGHFAVEISADVFTGQSKVACHRMIYQALADMMPQEIHALKITIKK